MKKTSNKYIQNKPGWGGKVPKISRVEEVFVPYDTAPVTYTVVTPNVEIEDLKYSSFKPILDKSPFTIAEWALLLYVSERTLHRYAKEDLSFNGLQTERILLIEELIDTGLDLFGKEGLKEWVHSSPFSLGGIKVFDQLFTHQGIQATIDILHRIQHGVSA